MTRVLRGVTWDHARGYDPLAKGAPLFTAAHPGYEIEWTRRSLRDFGVQPIEALAERFDILVIDHPFCGRAKATGSVLDLRPLFPAEFFAMLERESVGPSTRSYDYGGGVWGLPTDAAAQVASYRPDLLAALGFDQPPRTFARRHRTRQGGAQVRQMARAAWRSERRRLPRRESRRQYGIAGLAGFRRAACRRTCSRRRSTVSRNCGRSATRSRPSAIRSRPMTRWRRATTSSTRPSGSATPTIPAPERRSRSAIRRSPGPAPIRPPARSSAAPAARSRPDAGMSRPRSRTSPGCTRRSIRPAPYFQNGGQPGLRAAWTDPEDDREAGGFFSGTLPTLDKAHVRPRFDGFIPAFEHVGELVHRFLAGEGDARSIIRSSNEVYARARAAAKA